jgi:hypothetical protein
MEDGWSYGSVPLAYGLTAMGWGFPVLLLALFGVISPIVALLVGILGAIFLPILTFRLTKRLWIGLYYCALPHELRPRAPSERGDVH